MADPALTPRPWWHGTTIYQVYPRSFADSNRDGIGDLAGITSKLAYLADLGVETVWLSPVYASPQRDFGYDVAGYEDVAPEYGTLSDAEALIEEAHRLGMRVLFDMVLNHTSDEHPWFVESRSSRTNPKADWYLWRDGRGPLGRRRPNNWRSALELTSAWRWSPQRQQWYLATFLPFQPDLNWRNPEVREAMSGSLRFWLDRGVDGFRLDIFGSVMKDPEFRSNPLRPSLALPSPRLIAHDHTEHTPDNFALARELHDLCAAYEPERVLLGEVFGEPEILRGYLAGGAGLNLVFLFDFLAFRYSAAYFRSRIETYEAEFPDPMQPTYVLENHDRTRLLDRVGGDVEKAKVLAVLLCSLRGVVTIYQGQELGMANVHRPIHDALDPLPRTYFWWLPDQVARRLPELLNRDEVRTPMQWTRAPHAGFCDDDVEPWLAIPPWSPERNVEVESDDPGSVLALYRELLALRRSSPAMRVGALAVRPVDEEQPGLLVIDRGGETERFVVALNMSDAPVRCELGGHGELAVASGDGVRLEDGVVHLAAQRAAVVRIG